MASGSFGSNKYKQFCEDACKAFTGNDNRLFIVEQSKNLAYEEVRAILLKVKPLSTLFIVRDKFVARDLSLLFADIYKDFSVVTDGHEFSELTEKASGLPRVHAQQFKASHKNLILVADNDDNSSLLHMKLCKNTSLSGVYGNYPEKALYCVSDFLLDCEYDFVVVDDVYELLNGCRELKPDQRKEAFAPYEYDRMELFGKLYFADTEHSFDRLNAITSSAASCVLISNVITTGRTVDLYLALELMQREFSMAETRKTLERLSDDYEKDCYKIFSEILLCKDDENIIRECINFSDSAIQNVPSDVDVLREKLGLMIEYYSCEQVGLKALHSFLSNNKASYKLINEVYDDLFRGSDATIAKCFLQTFFSDGVKGEVEKELYTQHIHKMDEQETEKLMELFRAHGICHPATENNDIIPVRFYRDNSGFDYFAHYEIQSDADVRISVIGDESTDYYKASCIACNLKGKRNEITIKTPLIVVTDDVARMASDLTRMLGKEYVVTLDRSVLVTSANKNTVVVGDYRSLSNCPLALKTAAVVFAQVPSDPYTLAELDHALGEYCDGDRYIFLSYDKLGGMIHDLMFKLRNTEEEVTIEEVKEEEKPDKKKKADKKKNDKTASAAKEESVKKKSFDIPLTTVDIFETEKYTMGDISVLIKGLEKPYETLVGILEGRSIPKEKRKTVIDGFMDILTDFSPNPPFQRYKVNKDFKVMAKTCEPFADIFANTVSVGGKGVEIVGGVTGNYVFFNACARFLTNECDLTKTTCNGCKTYKKLKKNDSERLSYSVDYFFRSLSAILAGVKNVNENLKIASIDEAEDYEEGGTSFSDVEKALSGKADSIKKEVAKIVAGKRVYGMNRIEHSKVEYIRNALIDVYSKYFGQYYDIMVKKLDFALKCVSGNAQKTSRSFFTVGLNK